MLLTLIMDSGPCGAMDRALTSKINGLGIFRKHDQYTQGNNIFKEDKNKIKCEKEIIKN